jgi:hypothetical protein
MLLYSGIHVVYQPDFWIKALKALLGAHYVTLFQVLQADAIPSSKAQVILFVYIKKYNALKLSFSF